MDSLAGCSTQCDQKISTVSNAQKADRTVGEVFDDSITTARKNVENLCIKKAQLEAMQLLNHPYHQLSEMLRAYPF